MRWYFILDASRPEQIELLPDCNTAIVVLEGLSMYLTNSKVRGLLQVLDKKYRELRILIDVYTEFGARASKYKNPVNEVGVSKLYGIDDIESITDGLRASCTERYIACMNLRHKFKFCFMFLLMNIAYNVAIKEFEKWI